LWAVTLFGPTKSFSSQLDVLASECCPTIKEFLNFKISQLKTIVVVVAVTAKNEF